MCIARLFLAKSERSLARLRQVNSRREQPDVCGYLSHSTHFNGDHFAWNKRNGYIHRNTSSNLRFFLVTYVCVRSLRKIRVLLVLLVFTHFNGRRFRLEQAKCVYTTQSFVGLHSFTSCKLGQCKESIVLGHRKRLPIAFCSSRP